jgi:hypothetical protein
MVKNAVRALLQMALLLACASSWAVTGAAGANVSSQQEPTVIPGEYLVLFKARESVAELAGRDRTVAVAMMLEIQGEYLATKYGVTVQNTFSAISESSGKGMFFVRSEKAATDPEFNKKLFDEMRADPFIEGVSPNEVKKIISKPAVGSIHEKTP